MIYFSCVNKDGIEGTLAPIENKERHQEELQMTLERFNQKRIRGEKLSREEIEFEDGLRAITYKYYSVEPIENYKTMEEK